MSVTNISGQLRKQNYLYNILFGVTDIPKVSFSKIDDKNEFLILHSQKFMPDFRFKWCTVKNQYRVYILVGGREYEKCETGYCIFVVNSRLTAMEFGTFYAFLHRNRAHNKE